MGDVMSKAETYSVWTRHNLPETLLLGGLSKHLADKLVTNIKLLYGDETVYVEKERPMADENQWYNMIYKAVAEDEKLDPVDKGIMLTLYGRLTSVDGGATFPDPETEAIEDTEEEA
jgi:hypothetical protein